MRNVSSHSRWKTRWEMCSFHSRRPVFLSYAQAFWDSQKPQATQCVLSWGSREQKAQVEGAHRWREPAREATPHWVTLGTGLVPGVGGYPRIWYMSCESRWWSALLRNYVSWSSKGCPLNSLTPLHLQPQRERINTNLEKITPSLHSIFFLNLSLQIPNSFQQFLMWLCSCLTAKIRRPVTTTDTQSPSHLHFQTSLLKVGKNIIQTNRR